MTTAVEETVVDEEFIRLMGEYRVPPDSLSESPSLQGVLEACRDSVVLFAEYMLGIRLYAWQIDFLTRCEKALRGEYWTKEFAAITSRQIGKSTSLAIFALWAAVFNKYPDGIHNNTVVGIVSATDQQAKKLLYEVKKLVWNGDLVMEEKTGKVKFFSNLLDESQPNNTSIVTLKPHKASFGVLLAGSKAGSVVKSYPPTAVVLGETFTIVMIDEAGKHDRISDEFFYDYIYPTGNKADAVRIYTSTPWTPAGFFYRMVDPDGSHGGSPADVVMYSVNALKHEPTGQKQYESVLKTIEQLEKDGKVNEVRRAFFCEFIKGENSYFDPEQVDAMFPGSYSMFDEYGAPCDMGVDFGGEVKSQTVITISAFNEDTGEIARLYHRIYPPGPTPTLVDDIESLMERFNVQRIIPDKCPAGIHYIGDMKERGLNVQPNNEGMVFRRDKVSKYGAFRVALKNGFIRSYDDDDLKKEMKALEVSQTSTQSRIMAPRNYSDDLIDSFVMSCYFFLKEKERSAGWIDIDMWGKE